VIELFATGSTSTPASVLPAAQTVTGVTVTIGNVTTPATFAGLVAVANSRSTSPCRSNSQALPRAAIRFSSPSTIDTSPPGALVIPIQP